MNDLKFNAAEAASLLSLAIGFRDEKDLEKTGNTLTATLKMFHANGTLSDTEHNKAQKIVVEAGALSQALKLANPNL